MSDHKYFCYKNKELRTIGDVCREMEQIHTQEEADEFMEAVKNHGPHGPENIGYLTGYFDADRAQELRSLLKVSHPVFGNTTPTIQEAFRKGIEIGVSKS